MGLFCRPGGLRGERMSVLIKGMIMPTSCDNCWALDDYGDYPRYRITEEQRGYNFPIRQKRMDNCPLVEIPAPKIIAAKMQLIKETERDKEIAHIEADDLMCELLTELGYGEAVKIFEEMEKWYS